MQVVIAIEEIERFDNIASIMTDTKRSNSHRIFLKTQYWDKKILQLKSKKTFFIQYFFPLWIEHIYFWTIMLIET